MSSLVGICEIQNIISEKIEENAEALMERSS